MRFINGPFRNKEIPDNLLARNGSDERTLPLKVGTWRGFYKGGVWHNSTHSAANSNAQPVDSNQQKGTP